MLLGVNAIMWGLVRSNILRFSGMFKDSYVWLQITLEIPHLTHF